jgi:hypothetical protein
MPGCNSSLVIAIKQNNFTRGSHLFSYLQQTHRNIRRLFFVRIATQLQDLTHFSDIVAPNTELTAAVFVSSKECQE